MTRRLRTWRVGLFFGAVSLLTVGCSGLPSPQMKAPPKSFAGTWNTNWGTLQLTRGGRQHLHGRFKGFRNGHISGHVEGNRFVFSWRQKEFERRGRGYLMMTRDGDGLEGRWGYGRHYSNGGPWTADRIE